MTKPIILVKICYKTIVSLNISDKVSYMASADIKVFGYTYLFAMLLLIGLALFYTPGVFV